MPTNPETPRPLSVAAARRMRAEALQAAITRLAALFEFGALDAATRPAKFIDDAASEIERLRAELASGGDDPRLSRASLVAEIMAELDRVRLHGVHCRADKAIRALLAKEPP